jgi:hypothetical protein
MAKAEKGDAEFFSIQRSSVVAFPLECCDDGAVGDFRFALPTQPRLFFIEQLEKQAGRNGASE